MSYNNNHLKINSDLNPHFHSRNENTLGTKIVRKHSGTYKSTGTLTRSTIYLPAYAKVNTSVIHLQKF